MRNNKGFAISGMIYPILILSIFLIVQLLVTLQARKMILDKNKNDLVNQLNQGQKVYSNGTAIYFNPETNQKCSASEYKPGNSLNQNKSGCMKWYAFNDSEDSDTVNVILDHNTTYKVAWNSSGNNADGMKEVKTALESDTSNWNDDIKKTARLIEANEIAKITGNTEFAASNTDKDNWFYLENNAQTNPNLSQGQAKYKWLFDYTDGCTDYGCSIIDSSTYGYWTSTPNASYSRYAWYVYYSGRLYYYTVGNASGTGVRPVISIDKTVLDQEVPKPTPTPTPEVCQLLSIEGKNENGIGWTQTSLVNSSSMTGEYSAAGPKTMFKGHFIGGKPIRIYFTAIEGYTVSPNMQSYIILDDGTEVPVQAGTSGPTLGYIDFTLPKTVSQFNFPLYFSGTGSKPGTVILKTSMQCN